MSSFYRVTMVLKEKMEFLGVLDFRAILDPRGRPAHLEIQDLRYIGQGGSGVVLI
jgi:hypothetical protein